MHRKLVLLALFATCALHGAIKKAEQQKSDAADESAEQQNADPRSLREFTDPFPAALEKKLADQYDQLLEGHRPGAKKAAPATFPLRDAAKPADPLAFATGINADGWLLTKASEVKSIAQLQCKIRDKWVDVTFVRDWPDHDLALLRANEKDIPFVRWANGAPAVGSFITAVAPEDRDPLGIGVVSVAIRNERDKGRGFLGVQLKADDKGLKVDIVVPGSPAKASGIEREDRILELNGQKSDSVFTFTKMVSDHKAGEKVRLKVQRGDAVMEKEIALGDRANIPGAGRRGTDRMEEMGSTISKRRTDFPSVLQTDLPLQATQCGGPVTDLDGNVIGLVIARSGRVETMVLPSDTIRDLLGSVDFSTPVKAPVTR